MRRDNYSPARRWAGVVVLSASLLVITMDMTILNIALPNMAAELHPSSNQQLWIVDIYSLMLAGMLVSWAAVGDRRGRKRILLAGYFVFALSSGAILFADTELTVISIRAFLGVGEAMIMPTTLSLIRVMFVDHEERATALSVWAAASGLGVAVGPLIGGVLLEFFAWRAAFLINVPLMLVAVVAGAWIIPESMMCDPGGRDWVATALSHVCMVGLVWSIKEFGKEATLLLSTPWVVIAFALISLTWFVRRTLQASSPLIELKLFRSRTFTAGIVAALGSTFALVAALLLVVQWLQVIDGHSPIETGIRLIPIAIAGSAAALIAPPLSKRLGPRYVISGGLISGAIGMATFGFAGDALELKHILIGLILIGVGMGSLAVASAMIMASTPEDKAGTAGALEETSYELGATLGV